MEGGAEVLDGGDRDLVGCVYRDSLPEACEDVLELLVGLGGVWEDGSEQLPCLTHSHHLRERGGEREGGGERERG